MNSIIMVDDNQNSSIAYCEEIQMQAQTTRASGLGPLCKVP